MLTESDLDEATIGEMTVPCEAREDVREGRVVIGRARKPCDDVAVWIVSYECHCDHRGHLLLCERHGEIDAAQDQRCHECTCRLSYAARLDREAL